MSQDLSSWCQRRYRDRYRRLRVLSVPNGDSALWLDDGRVRAVVCSSLPESGFFGIQLALVRDAASEPQWYLREVQSWDHQTEASALELLDAADVEPDEALRRMVVHAIHSDHERQLAETLVAGFVKRLDQQFPRAELYLFELLQNAVDEGAQRVSFELKNDEMVFQHDGKSFNASDILGLSAVGASGKSGRTIGFMGLGFKAVYSRFDRVTLAGGGWRVKFERLGDNRDGHWKFLPEWCCAAVPPDPGFTCRFEFGRAKGAANALAEDLSKLDYVVPVLLARRALSEKEDDAVWKLNWNGKQLTVKRETNGSMGVEHLTLTDGTQERRWMFLGTTWTPSQAAVAAWRDFRDDQGGNPGDQELALFAELTGEGNLRAENGRGILHAVLPTSEELPFGFNLQANWLLRADRQGAMSARDNEWNASIVCQLPRLILGLLQWIADNDGPQEVEEPYRRLPILKRSSGHPELEVLGISVDFTSVIDAVAIEELVPCRADMTALLSEGSGDLEGSAAHDRAHARRKFSYQPSYNYKFVRSSDCREVPDELLSGLSPRFLTSWLGGNVPFAFMSNDRAGAFFRSAGVIDQVSEAEWKASATHYETALASLPNDRVRAWASLYVFAVVLRARKQGGGLPKWLAIVPNGHWHPCAQGDLAAPPRQYLLLDQAAREILEPIVEETPAIPMLQAVVAPPSGSDVEIESLRIVNEALWPSPRDLREITEPFFRAEFADQSAWASAPDQHIRRIVAVTSSVRALGQGHDAVTHVLSIAAGDVRLRPKQDVWVGAAYGFVHVEVASGGRVPLVASVYGDDVGWWSFFASACRTRLEPFWEISATIDARDRAGIREFLHEMPKISHQDAYLDLPLNLGKHPSWEIHAISTSLHPWVDILADTDFDFARSRSFAALIGQGLFSPKTSNNRSFAPQSIYVTWIADKKSREYAVSTKQLPRWVTTLRNRPWVPTDSGKVVVPREVLLTADPRNPGAPVANLDEATRQGLTLIAEALQFGVAVPRPGPLATLLRAAEKAETSAELLLTLWHEVIADANLDVALLREKARIIDLIPVSAPRRDGKWRVASTRLVKAGNADFGGFLCAVADSLLKEYGPRLDELFGVPDRPTSKQAILYLEWVWACEPPDVEDAVAIAWRQVVADRSVWPSVEECQDSGKLKLFCRQPGARKGEWLCLPSGFPREPIWNDDPAKSACLRPADGLWLESWLVKRSQDWDVAAFVELTGLTRLSDDRFRLQVRRVGDYPMAAETGRLRNLIAAVEAIHEGEQLPPNDLALRRAESIDRTFQIGDGAERAERIDASWDGRQTIHVVGRRSAAWATDLRPLVQQALGLGGNARALRLLDLIPLLDDGENFDRKFDQLRYELEVPGEDTKDEPPFLPRSRDNEPNGDDDETAGDSRDIVDADDPDGAGSDEDLSADDTDGSAKRKSADPNRRAPGANNGGGSGPGGIPRTSSGKSGGSWDPGVAPDRFLIQHQATNEGDDDNERERRLPKDDKAGREAVMNFERRFGRDPTEADRFQRGYDVSSQDGEVTRKIEVKGLQGAWQGQATVTMTGPQFDDARFTEGDWWLYVVEYAGSDRANVIAIPNPAKGTRTFYLYACHWRAKAVAPTPRALLPPDDDDDD